uniref:Peptidase S8/S53 domain-containing protein n=1 Tax=Panagrolaimus sp. ES5 TaxID=591445 RepID=A0AC34FXA3_9BILA
MSQKNYIPKEATQQIEFLKKYPEFDGRGIKIAVVDSDVADMNLPGLQKTSIGLPKIIDVLPRKRITIDTSTVVGAKDKTFITGLITQVAAAYFPDDPEGSGLAPGAQIISLHWGNFEEVLYKCIELKVDIVNFSFAFPLRTELDSTTYAKIKEIVKIMIEEHGIIIVQGAGNTGPFHFLYDEYSLLSDQIFFVGSFFAAEVKDKFESDENMNNQVHNFSSRGPLPSGARGIDFVAPGSAITDLPKWYPKKNDRNQGTSLATPNIAGSIACLLSALKANSIKYTPAMIKMALANTAFLPSGADKLAYGHGIIQINDAFEFIKTSINILPMKSSTPIFLNDPNQKGILHIQNGIKNNNNLSTINYTVNIDSADDIKWILKCFPDDNNFVRLSTTLTNDPFNVKIDTNILEEGSLNYAEIHAFNYLIPSIGPLFYLPITVICPAFPNYFEKEMKLEPGPPKFLFFKRPSEFQQEFYIKITSLEGQSYAKIIMEYYQKNNDVRGRDILKFNAKKKTKTILLKIEEGEEELIQICFHHTHLNPVKFKININCQKSCIS